jgi:hypothetical protein
MSSVYWCVTHPEDSKIIAETCSRDRNFTVVFAVCACVDVANKTYIIIAGNGQCLYI